MVKIVIKTAKHQHVGIVTVSMLASQHLAQSLTHKNILPQTEGIVCVLTRVFFLLSKVRAFSLYCRSGDSHLTIFQAHFSKLQDILNLLHNRAGVNIFKHFVLAQHDPYPILFFFKVPLFSKRWLFTRLVSSCSVQLQLVHFC